MEFPQCSPGTLCKRFDPLHAKYVTRPVISVCLTAAPPQPQARKKIHTCLTEDQLIKRTAHPKNG